MVQNRSRVPSFGLTLILMILMVMGTLCPLAGLLPPALGQEGQRQAASTGKSISLDFQDADIVDVLRLIAAVSELNIITSDEVKGKITMRLVNVPWEQALDVILKTKGFGQIREGNIIRVSLLKSITEEQKALQEAQMVKIREQEAVTKAKEQEEPLERQVIPINYTKPADLAPHLEKIRSPRGDVKADAFTNSLIVRDLKKNLEEMVALVKQLDKQTPQVLIEARIVETSANLARQLGVKWGFRPLQIRTAGQSKTTGAPQTQVQIGGVGLGTTTGGLSTAANLPIAAAATGALQVLVSSAGLNMLDIELSAMESSGKGRILTRPQIATLDNKKAEVKSGDKIPVPTRDANGNITTTFVDANITLTVTPHVTADNFVSMDITVEKSEADFARSVQGIPTIVTRKASTFTLVRDGETAVIGGLQKQNVTGSETGVPWLSKIPILGWLFKNQIKSEINDDLLIFLSPRIVKSELQE